MTITREQDLTQFEFWQGAKVFAENLTYTELKEISFQLEDLNPNGMTETEINDLFWFEDNFIAQMIGETTEEIYNR